MKKLSEVCRLVGVTRRTLQEYADKSLQLVMPTYINESGYWFYDDEAIQKLMFIQIFVEAGYERKEIKDILESPDLDISAEFEKVIVSLREKRKRITGMINTVKAFKAMADLPENTLQNLAKSDLISLYSKNSFTEHFDNICEAASEYTDSEITESETYLPFLYKVLAIGSCCEAPDDTAQARIAVCDAYNDLKAVLNAAEEEEGSGHPLTEEDMLEIFEEEILELTDNDNFRKMLKLRCEGNAAEFIKQSVHLFKDSFNTKN